MQTLTVGDTSQDFETFGGNHKAFASEILGRKGKEALDLGRATGEAKVGKIVDVESHGNVRDELFGKRAELR